MYRARDARTGKISYAWGASRRVKDIAHAGPRARAKDSSRRGPVDFFLQDQVPELGGLQVTQAPLEHDLCPTTGVARCRAPRLAQPGEDCDLARLPVDILGQRHALLARIPGARRHLEDRARFHRYQPPRERFQRALDERDGLLLLRHFFLPRIV